MLRCYTTYFGFPDINNWFKEIEERDAKLEIQYNRIDEKDKKISKLEDELRAYKTFIEKMKSQNDEKKQQLSELQKNLRKIKKENKILIKSNEHLNEIVDAIFNE